MAISRSFVAGLLFVCLVLCLIHADQEFSHQKATSKLGFEQLSMETIDCSAECNRRCQLASRLKMCTRACNACCAKCNCVPPGTSGNQEVCPCYANMTTHDGKKKCP